MASSANSRPDAGGAGDPHADSARADSRLGAWLYRHRGATAVPLAVYVVWAARPTFGAFACGALLALAGEALRVAALRHAGAHTRGRNLRAPHLATGGPYARLRHPLYVGNALACAGLLTASRAGWPGFPALFALLFAAQYALFIRREERFLAAAFGPTWRAYAARVPALGIPPTRGKGTSAAVAAAAVGPPPAPLGAALRLEFPTLRTLVVLLILIALRPLWPGPR